MRKIENTGNGMSIERRRSFESAENDFVELIQALWTDRWIVGCIFMLVVGMTFFYAVMSPKVYQSDVIVFPPHSAFLAEYNELRVHVGWQELKADDAYKAFTEALNSESFRSQFFGDVKKASGVISKDDAGNAYSDNEFEPVISVNTPDRRRPRKIQVAVQAGNPADAAKLAALYVSKAEQKARMDLAERLQAYISGRIRSVDEKILVERQLVLLRRQERVSQLQEALALAKTAGIERSLLHSLYSSSGKKPSSVDDGLHLLGARALEAELEALRAKKSDGVFSDQLRALTEELFVLKSAKVDAGKIVVFTMDRAASENATPVKPRILLSVVFGAVLGAILGVLVGMIRYLARRRAP